MLHDQYTGLTLFKIRELRFIRRGCRCLLLWCRWEERIIGACQEACRATKTLSYTHIPTILIVHLKRLILGKKIQNHTLFDTTLEMDPYMAPGHGSSQKMELIGIISHQGDRKTRALCRNNKKRERMDITQRRHNNPDNTNTPTPITGIRIDV